MDCRVKPGNDERAHGRLRLFRGLTMGLLAVAALAGCDDGRPVNLADFDYRLAHPLSAEPRTALLMLEVPEQPGAALGGRDAARLAAFAQDFVNGGDGSLELLVVGTETDAAAAGLFAETLIRALADQGVQPGRIAARLVVDADRLAAGSAMLRYRQWVANVPECGQWGADVQADHRGVNSPNFGCATQHNIGVMVANPKDLVRPQPAGARDGAVADRAITRYRGGEDTRTFQAPYEGR